MLETERLIIRPIKIKDSPSVFNYRSDQETNKYQGWIPKTLEDVNAFISKNPTEFNQPESWFQLVIIEKQSNRIIGDFGVHFLGEENLQSEIGCTLNKDYHGKGYATEAAKSIINFLFTNLNKHRITASIDPENKNSIQLVERLGFRKEAHFIQSLLLDGKWVDDIVYAVLKSEWT